MVIHHEWRSHEWCITKPSSGYCVTGLYHRMRGKTGLRVTRVSQSTKAMDERETESYDLFELLTQSLFDPGADDLPEVDQLLSQVPLPEDFELEPTDAAIVNEGPGLTSETTNEGPGSTSETGETYPEKTRAHPRPSASGQRFGRLVTQPSCKMLLCLPTLRKIRTGR